MVDFDAFHELFVEKINKKKEDPTIFGEVTIMESEPDNILIKYREFIKNGNSYFECPFCLNLFIDEYYLKKHILRKHNDILY